MKLLIIFALSLLSISCGHIQPNQKIVSNTPFQGVQQNLTLSANTYQVVAVWARGGSGGEIFRMTTENFDASANVNRNITLTTTYQKFYIIFNTGADTTSV